MANPNIEMAAASQQAEEAQATKKKPSQAQKAVAKGILGITNAKLGGTQKKAKGIKVSYSLPSPSQQTFAPFFSSYLIDKAMKNKRRRY